MTGYVAPAHYDLVGPFRGPCGICGWPDARHRMVEAIAGRFHAGDSAESLTEDYGGLSVEDMFTIAAAEPEEEES